MSLFLLWCIILKLVGERWFWLGGIIETRRSLYRICLANWDLFSHHKYHKAIRWKKLYFQDLLIPNYLEVPRILHMPVKLRVGRRHSLSWKKKHSWIKVIDNLVHSLTVTGSFYSFKWCFKRLILFKHMISKGVYGNNNVGFRIKRPGFTPNSGYYLHIWLWASY